MVLVTAAEKQTITVVNQKSHLFMTWGSFG